MSIIQYTDIVYNPIRNVAINDYNHIDACSYHDFTLESILDGNISKIVTKQIIVVHRHARRASTFISECDSTMMHYIRHKCINTGEVYYTYIIFDSNIYYYFGKCDITGRMYCIMFLSQTCITTLYGCNILE